MTPLQPETSNSKENTMDTVTAPDLRPLYRSIGEASDALDPVDDAVEEALQAALGVEHDNGTWDDSGDDMEPFEVIKTKLAEARLALSAAQGQLAYVEGQRVLRGAG